MNLVFPKSMEGYFVSKERLLSLLRSEQKLIALNYSGVDNWDYYNDAIVDHVRAFQYDHEDFTGKTIDDIANYVLGEEYAD